MTARAKDGSLFGISGYSNVLQAALSAAKAGGTCSCQIAGLSGMGKTSLALHHTNLFRSGGIYLYVKFSQLDTSNSYAAINEGIVSFCSALSEIGAALRQEYEIAIKRELGALYDVLATALPAMASMLGDPKPIQELPSEREAARLQRAYVLFFRALRNVPRCTTFIFDDLQWLDAETAPVLRLIWEDGGANGALFIFLYRSDEFIENPNAGHFLQTIVPDGKSNFYISLSALTPENTRNLISTTLGADCRALVDFVFEKTGGNPFYVKEFTEYAIENRLVRVDGGRVEFDARSLEALEHTKSASDLMRHVLLQLSARALELAKFFALLGEVFNVSDSAKLYALVYNESFSENDLSRATAELISNGIIVSSKHLDGYYTYRHDGIQKAALDLNENILDLRLRIANELLTLINQPNSCWNIVNVADHYRALEISTFDDDLAQKVFSVYSKSVEYARSHSAYNTYLKYSELSIALCNANQNLMQYKPALQAALAEAEMLCGNNGKAGSIVDSVISERIDKVAMAKAYEVKVKLYMKQGHAKLALDALIQALADLTGLKIRSSPVWQFAYIMRGVLIPSTDFIVADETPDIPDYQKLKTIEDLLVYGSACAYWSDQNYIPGIFYFLLRLGRKTKSTNTPYILACSSLVMVGCNFLEKGIRFGKRALETLDSRSDHVRTRAYCCVYSSSYPCFTHLRKTIEPLNEAHLFGINSADYDFAAVAGFQVAYHSYFASIPLDKAYKDCTDTHKSLSSIGHAVGIHNNLIYMQAMQNLMRFQQSPCALVGPHYDAIEMKIVHEKAAEYTTFTNAYLAQLSLSAYYGDWASGVKNSVALSKYLHYARGVAVLPLSFFYSAVSYAMHALDAPVADKRKLLKQGRKQLASLNRYAQFAPMNYGHKYRMGTLCLEYGANKLSLEETIRGLKGVIDVAVKEEYINDAALASRVAFALASRSGSHIDPEPFYVNAIKLFRSWGAHGAASQLHSAMGSPD